MLAGESRSESVNHHHLPVRRHPQWQQLVRSLEGQLTAAELLSLNLDTLVDLARYVGLTSAVDIAHVELAWHERQPYLDQQVGLLAQNYGVGIRAEGNSAGGRGHYIDLEGDLGSEALFQSGMMPAEDDDDDEPSPPYEHTPKEGAGARGGRKMQEAYRTGRVNKTVRARIDTGAVKRRSTGMDDDNVICVEDAKNVFTRFAAYANGNPKQLDGSRFFKMTQEAGLLDKLFTHREAEQVFATTKKNVSSDRSIPYHVFRMKLLPEIASKKRCSIADLVKMLNHHGGPAIKQRVSPPPPPPLEDEEQDDEIASGQETTVTTIARRDHTGVSKRAGSAPPLL